MKNLKKVIFALSLVVLVFGLFSCTAIKNSKKDIDVLKEKLDILENTKKYMFILSYKYAMIELGYSASVDNDKIYTVEDGLPLYHFIENDVKYVMTKRGGEWYKYRESDDIDYFTMETQNLLKKDNFVYDNDKEKIVLKKDYQCLNENIKIENLVIAAVEDNLEFEYDMKIKTETFKVLLIVKDINNVKVDLPKVDVDKSNEILDLQ